MLLSTYRQLRFWNYRAWRSLIGQVAELFLENIERRRKWNTFNYLCLEEHSSFDRGYRCWSFLSKLPSIFLGEMLVRQCWWIAVDIFLNRIHLRCLLLDWIVISRWAVSASIGSFLWASAWFPGYGGPSSLFLRRFSNGGRGIARFFSCSVYYRSLLVSWLVEGYGFNP